MAAVLSSCSYSSYIPVTVSEPLLKEKGQRQGIAYVGANHVEVQGAYAFTNHFAVQGDIWRGTDKRYSMDLLPGYYFHSPGGFCFGIYGGGGIANTTGTKEIVYSNMFNRVNERYENHARYTSLIFQPGAGFRKKNFEIGFAVRVSYVSYSQYHSKKYMWSQDDDATPQLMSEFSDNGFSIWIFQPAFNVSAGFENVKAFFSASINVPADLKSMNSAYRHPHFQHYLFSSGIKIDLKAPGKFKKQQKVNF